MDYYHLDILILLKICAIFLLLLFSGFFSGSETSLFSLSMIQRERLKHQGQENIHKVNELLKHPGRLITTILIGNDLINIAASVIAAYLTVSMLGEQGKWVAILIMTPLTLVFAEIIPKTVAIAHNERFSLFVAGPILLFSKIISPLRWIFEKVADLVIFILGIENQPQSGQTLMENDFLEMVDISHEDGEIKRAEKDLIHNVFEFSDTPVKEVMTPFEDIFMIPHNIKITQLIEKIKEEQYSRMPVYQNDKNNIIGILYAKDLLKFETRNINVNTVLSPRMWRKAIFVSETHKVDAIFYYLKRQRTHIAICHDAGGNVTGLISMEDLLEELFGEIYDEGDQGEQADT